MNKKFLLSLGTLKHNRIKLQVLQFLYLMKLILFDFQTTES